MTASEIREEFNLRYNNALEGAPGLDTFEISTYLTIAQEQYVKVQYDAAKDPNSSFEQNEKSRRALDSLVKNVRLREPLTNVFSTSDNNPLVGLTDESVFFAIAEDVMYIVLETITYNGDTSLPDRVIGGKTIPVIPTTHDEFMLSYNNPFRKPNVRKAFRIDSSFPNPKIVTEIIADNKIRIQQYNVRYIARPTPIIVESLESAEDVAGLGLTIEGNVAESPCYLNDFTHRDIVNIAVENAVLDYRESNLQGRMQLDSRV